MSLAQPLSPDQPQDFPSPVPAIVLSRIRVGFQQPLFPSSLQFFDLYRSRRDQFPASTIVFGPLVPVRPQFPRQRSVDVHFVSRIEEGVELVELALGDRIELVIVTCRATDGRPQPDRPDGGDPVLDLHHAKFLDVGPPFPVAQGLAKKPRGDLLLDRRLRQQVAGQLFDREPVEGHVAVESLDDPVPKSPRNRPQLIRQVTVTVGVVSHVEPRPGPAFPVVRRGEQTVDDPLVGTGTLVLDERRDLARCRRQPDQVKRDATNQRLATGDRRWNDPLTDQPSKHEQVDRVPGPRSAGCGRNVRTNDRTVGPVTLFGRISVGGQCRPGGCGGQN